MGDDIYSGGSLKKTINIVKERGAKIESPIFTLGNFSGTKELLNLYVFSVISEKGNLYTKEDCPMCRKNCDNCKNWTPIDCLGCMNLSRLQPKIPLVKPGSRK